MTMRNFPVLVLYALLEQRIGLTARRYHAAFTPRRGVHLVMVA